MNEDLLLRILRFLMRTAGADFRIAGVTRRWTLSNLHMAWARARMQHTAATMHAAHSIPPHLERCMCTRLHADAKRTRSSPATASRAHLELHLEDSPLPRRVA